MAAAKEMPQNASRIQSWWHPRYRIYTLTVLMGLAWFVPMLDFIHRGLRGDFWWVWASGQWMSLHHHLLSQNPAAWNGSALGGKTWVNLEWGWEWILYHLDPHQTPIVFLLILFGMELLMAAALFWAMSTLAPKLSIEIKAGLYLVYAAFIFPFTVKLRAEMFSYVAFPLLLGILWRARQDRRWLSLLIPLTMVWANIHGSWLLIPVLAGLEVLRHVLRKDWGYAGWTLAGGTLGPVLAATIFTPFHLRTLTYAWWLDHNHWITTYIQEWQSVNFHETIFLVWAAVIIASWIWRARSGLSYPWLLDVWMLGTTVAFFEEARMVTYFGEVFILWWAYGLGREERRHEFLSVRGQPATRIGLGVAGLLVLVLSLGFGIHERSRYTAPEVPSTLVSWINGRPHGVVLAPVDVGGYLIAHQVQDVFLDGRADFFLANGHRFQQYVAMIGSGDQVNRLTRDFSVDHVSTVLWPKGQLTANLAGYLAKQHFHREAIAKGWVVWIR